MDTKSTIQRIGEEMDRRNAVWNILSELCENYDMTGCLIAYDSASGEFKFLGSGYIQTVKEGISPKEAFSGINIHENEVTRAILFESESTVKLVDVRKQAQELDPSRGPIYQVNA